MHCVGNKVSRVQLSNADQSDRLARVTERTSPEVSKPWMNGTGFYELAARFRAFLA